MDNAFWKLFTTLFGIGAMISYAKSLKLRKPLKEVISDCIISGFLSTGAALLYVYYPTLPVIAIAGGGALLAVLGVHFFSEKIEAAVDRLLPRKEEEIREEIRDKIDDPK